MSYIQFPDKIKLIDDIIKCQTIDFYAIVALDVLEHVDDLASLLSNLCKRIVPGGKIIVSG